MYRKFDVTAARCRESLSIHFYQHYG